MLLVVTSGATATPKMTESEARETLEEAWIPSSSDYQEIKGTLSLIDSERREDQRVQAQAKALRKANKSKKFDSYSGHTRKLLPAKTSGINDQSPNAPPRDC